MPTATATPTETATAFPFGDVDCSGSVNSVDSLKILRFASGLAYGQAEPCEDIRTGTLPNGWFQGDVDCSTSVNSIDSLKLLRYGSGLVYSQNEPPPCPDIGT
jgi:hypothetical protein